MKTEKPNGSCSIRNLDVGELSYTPGEFGSDRRDREVKDPQASINN